MAVDSLNLIELLKRFAKLERNVLLTGHTGVGKTTCGLYVLQDLCSFRVKFFNAAIMDPQVELLGIPSPSVHFDRDVLIRVLTDFAAQGIFAPQKSESPQATYARVGQLLDTALDKPKSLDFLRPKFIDECDVFFVDEINRAETQTLNGIMEAIQFCTVMGDRLPRLRMTWATRNPDGDEMGYHVQRLDPAILLRFHCFVEVEGQPSVDILVAHGPMREAVARNLVDWWSALDEKTKLNLPPRTLTYIGRQFEDGLPLQYSIPPTVDITKLPMKQLQSMLQQATKSTLVSKDDLKTPQSRKTLTGRMTQKGADGKLTPAALSTTMQVQKMLAHPSMKLTKVIECVELVEAINQESRYGLWASLGTRLMQQVPNPAQCDWTDVFGAQADDARRFFRLAVTDGFYADIDVSKV